MQVPPANPGSSLPAPVAAVVARVLSGDLTAIPIGQLLRATVTNVAGPVASLTVNGQPVTVKSPGGLQPGTVMLVRVAPGSTPALEVVGRAPATPQTPPTTASTEPARLSVVDVLSNTPDGRAQVRIDGQGEATVSGDGLVPGERYVLEVVPTPAGLTVRPPADGPNVSTAVAAAVLRGLPPANVPATLEPLMTELQSLPDHPAVRQAAEQVRQTVASLLPADGQPPGAADLQRLVENGGLQYEAKLARLAGVDSASVPKGEGSPPSALAGRPPSPAEAGIPTGDLKGGLLKLLQAAHDIGVTALPAARAAADGIEAQQAANVLAKTEGTPFVLQVPFPDRDGWRTLHLAIEADRQNADAESPATGDFRLLVHVPLSDLGETWVETAVTGDRLRAVFYVDGSAGRDRIRAELPDLCSQLRSDGFGEVLLDVRSAADLPDRLRARAAAMRAGRGLGGTVLDARA